VAKNASALKQCINVAFEWDNKIVVENALENYTEVNVAVLGGCDGHDDGTEVLSRVVSEVAQKCSLALRVQIGSPVSGYWQVPQSFKDAVNKAAYSDLRSYTTAPELGHGKSPFSIRLAKYVLEHYKEELSLQSIAARFKCNAAYVGQVFKRDIGTTFGEYLRQVRINKAQELLRDTQLSAADIAAQVGIGNVSYFFSLFKKHVGQSPSDYRRSE
jgi:YesN/AraC family two-component response regulator